MTSASCQTVALAQECVWVYHEITKGVINPLFRVKVVRHRSAGWAFNSDWDLRVEDGTDDYGDPEYRSERRTAQQAAQIANADLVAKPFFKEFNPDRHDTVPRWWKPEAWLYLPAGDPEILRRLPSENSNMSLDKIKNHAKLLAEMIPPLSSPAGGKRLRVFAEGSGNEHRALDMHKAPFKDESIWPETRPGKSKDQQEQKRWLHGDYKDAPYLLTHKLYEIITEISGKD